MNPKPTCVVIHASTFFAPILVPLLFYFLADHPYVKEKALEALLFHIAMAALLTISAFLMIVLIGFILLPIFSLVAIYYPIKGIIRALQEEPFHYPIVHNWVR